VITELPNSSQVRRTWPVAPDQTTTIARADVIHGNAA
jgi:hypothetical protein